MGALALALAACGTARPAAPPAEAPPASRALAEAWPARRSAPQPGDPVPVTWSLRDPDSGRIVVETATGRDDVRWWLEHRLEVGGGEAAISAWIGIENTGAAPLGFADVALAEGALSTGPLALAPGETAIVPVASARGAARTVRLFDPVGEAATRAQVVPVLDRRHGLDAGDGVESVALAIELGPELVRAASAWPRAPVAVFERVGSPLPLGRAVLGGGEQRALVAVGAAPGLIGRRRRTELSIDEPRRRVVEELRIELENRGPRAEEVLVREHLYRGLEWTMAYENGVGRVEKIAPQVVLFRLALPPGARREIVYRVVYTW